MHFRTMNLKKTGVLPNKLTVRQHFKVSSLLPSSRLGHITTNNCQCKLNHEKEKESQHVRKIKGFFNTTFASSFSKQEIAGKLEVNSNFSRNSNSNCPKFWQVVWPLTPTSLAWPVFLSPQYEKRKMRWERGRVDTWAFEQLQPFF